MRKFCFYLVLLAVLVAGCGRAAPAATEAPHLQDGTPLALQPTPPPVPTAAGDLAADEAATLASLQKVGDYPLYTMHYVGDYGERLAVNENAVSRSLADAPGWACSLFAALGDPAGRLYGRNFDWEYSPALLLFTDPPDGYASVSMVDIAYLVQPGQVGRLDEAPPAERRALLDAPAWPFDGMNEHGLAVGMAAVPPGNLPPDPAKETVGSLGVIREMLDHAKDVGEAVAILQNYNIDFEGGPPLHYLLADRAGRAMLVEFYQGQMVLHPNQGPWQQATNFLLAGAGAAPQGNCGRYDRLDQRLTEAKGVLTVQEAMQLLSQVAQDGTQWSVIYGISTGSVTVVMGQEYGEAYTLTGIWR